MRVEKWAQERDEMFKRSLGQLKTDILKANSLVQEANFLAEEMDKQTKFSVTLQIPPYNLSPNRKVINQSIYLFFILIIVCLIYLFVLCCYVLFYLFFVFFHHTLGYLECIFSARCVC